MRFGNASTTVTGTVTPASVNTRVIPHLRPTRPMVIVNPHTAGSFDWLPHSLQQVSGLDNGPQNPLRFWRRRPRAPTSKMAGGLYFNPPVVQDCIASRFAPNLTGYSHALRATSNGADAAPPYNCSLREQKTQKTLSSA